MRIKNFLTIIIVLVCIMVSVNAEYEKVGNDDTTFYSDDGLFNENLLSVSSETFPLTDGSKSPLVSDMDGDGINEIIVEDDTSFTIFQTKDLNPVLSWTPKSNCITYSNSIIQDIDNDGYKELIVGCQDNSQIFVGEYNGTHFYQQSNITTDIVLTVGCGSAQFGDMVIGCNSDNKCLFAQSNCKLSHASNLIKAGFFNATAKGSLITAYSNAYTSVYCFPHIKTMSVADYESTPDGNEEFIFSMYDSRNGQTDTYNIMYVGVTGNVSVLERSLSKNGFNAGLNLNCSAQNQGNHLTAPLVSDLYVSSGLETVIGYMIDDNEFNMGIWRAGDTSEWDAFPEALVGDADGKIVSNVVQMSVFDDDNKEFCVMGYQDELSRLDLLCGSKTNTIQSGFEFESAEFWFDTSGRNNISGTFDRYDIFTNTLQTKGDYISPPNSDILVNVEELSTMYGIFDIQWTTFNPLVSDLDLIFANPVGSGAVLMSDVEDTGFSDMLVLKQNNLYYIDDKFTNEGARIDAYRINPCLDSIWKINTTVGVRVTPYDEYDTVRARVILYAGTVDAIDSNWSAYFSSGTAIPFNFVANKTISNGILALYVSDSNSPTTVQNINFSFTVATNGVSYGDCVTEVSGIVESEEVNVTGTPENPTVDDNAIDDAFAPFIESTGLGSSVVWLIFMMALAIIIFVFNRHEQADDKVSLMIITVVEILMLVIGVKIGYISAGLVWILVILGVIGAGIWVSNKFFHPSNNGGG